MSAAPPHNPFRSTDASAFVFGSRLEGEYALKELALSSLREAQPVTAGLLSELAEAGAFRGANSAGLDSTVLCAARC